MTLSPSSDSPAPKRAHFRYHALLRALLIVLVLGLASALTILRMNFVSVYVGAIPEKLVQGIGHLPYQYRALVPWCVAMLQNTPIPDLLTDWIPAAWLTVIGLKLQSAPNITATFLAFETASMFALMLSFLALTRLFVNGVLRQLLGLAFLLMALILLQAYTPGPNLFYPSDTISVVVVILSYLLLFAGRIVAFYPLFILGTLNRETTLFILPILWFLPPNIMRPRHWLTGPIHSCVLLGVWITIKASLFFKYRGNHGYVMHPNILENLAALQEPLTIAATISCLGGFLLLWVLATRKAQDGRLCAAFYGALSLSIGLFCAGKLDELRIFSELAPLTALAFLLTLTPKRALIPSSRL